MSIKLRVLMLALVAIGTLAAVKLVPVHHTGAPYATAFRVTTSNAMASCPTRACVSGPTRCVTVTCGGGCNVRQENGQYVCGPVQICACDPDPPIIVE